MPVVSTMKLTSRQFLAMEDPPGARLELVNGELAVSPSPRPDHSRVEKRLSRVLLNHIIEHDLGELIGDVDTILSPYDVRRPDLLYFQKDRVHLIPAKDALNAVPDLCVEIVSPSSGTIDRIDKFQQYADAGIVCYWIVDPAKRSVEAYRLADGQYDRVGSGHDTETVSLPPFEELRIPLAELWVPSSWA